MSSDLLHWTYLPCALAPDKEYDRDGVFSGTALVENDEHVLMYTSVKIKNKGETNEEIRQEQSIAIGDGENYQKLENNPVISSEHLPEGFNKEDFRDPKIWRENDNFYAIVAHRAEDKSGQILLFKSADLREWQYQGSLLRSNKEIGLMWECPDLLKLNLSFCSGTWTWMR